MTSFVDPHWFQCGSGSSFLSQLKADTAADPDPRSQTNGDPCGSESGFWSDFISNKKLNFFLKLQVGILT
jgi:hypothetical protein